MTYKIPEFLRDEWPHIDIECRSLVSALNFLPGIKVVADTETPHFIYGLRLLIIMRVV